MDNRPLFPIWRINERTFADPHQAGDYAIRLCRTTDQPIRIYERNAMQEGWKLYCEVIPTRAHEASLSA
jgi:hypothetical protein